MIWYCMLHGTALQKVNNKIQKYFRIWFAGTKTELELELELTPSYLLSRQIVDT
jgi:hypothetical protein